MLHILLSFERLTAFKNYQLKFIYIQYNLQLSRREGVENQQIVLGNIRRTK